MEQIRFKMLPEERRRRILRQVHESGSMNVASLSSTFRVSPATIRRDLHVLEEQGNLQRTHGGAVPPSFGTSYEPIYRDKMRRNSAEKEAIARHAFSLVRDGDVVILDSGSTTLTLAMQLKSKRNVTVITGDLQIALSLADSPNIEVIITGGKVRTNLFSIVGPTVEATLADLNANIAFLGADGISVQAGVTNANLEEAAIKRCMLRAGQQKVLLADHTKFGRIHLAKVCGLEVFDDVITDVGLPEDVLDHYVQVNASITCVG